MDMIKTLRSDTQQFGQLRARIEASFSEPALIVITSAARGDGKTATAFGLAEALAETDCRVLFVDGNVDAPVLPRVHLVPAVATHREFSNICKYAKPVPGQRFSALSFADPRIEAGMSMEKAKAAVFDMRSHFDFIIMDTSPVLRSDLAVLFAAIADGTLLTLRLGRFPAPGDEETMKTLTRIGANMLGVLTVSQNMIKEFAQQRQELLQRQLVPARHVTSRHSLERDSVADIVEPKPSNAAI
jgi:Mrp family chromosome partitioning ATPase